MCVSYNVYIYGCSVRSLMCGTLRKGRAKRLPVFEVHKIISEYVVCMIMCM